MKKIIVVLLILVARNNSFAQQAFYDVIAANGNGVRFWQGDNFKIHMGNTAEYRYGPVTDYSIKMNMDATPGRGWTWGLAGSTPVAAIGSQGNMQIAGSFTVGGDITLPSVNGNKQIYTWSPGDANWRVGMSPSPGFTTSLATQHVQYLTYSSSAGQGFAVGVNGGQSSFEIIGSNHNAFFRGNVGIGTTSPGLTAHVLGPLGFPASSGASQTGILRLQGVGSNGVLDFSVNAGSGASLQVTNQTDLSQKYPLILNPNGGNVGIGTTSPSSKLHLTGGSTSNSISNVFNTVTTRVDVANPAISLGIGYVASDIPMIQSFNNVTNGPTNIALNPFGGAVGIGTSSPGYPLDVQGSGSRLLNPSAATGAYTSFRVQGPNYTNGLEIDFFGNNNISTDLNWSYGGGAGSVAVVNVNAKPLTFGTNNQGRMLIDAAGNVGIGTFAPDAKLTVSGQVHAQEVKVSVTVPGPDYVFEKDYKLTSLEEIKNYIDQNKHLPEVPSAKEMEKNGVQLGEMNMLLLKKIEELTLHMLEQQQQIKNLQTEIQTLKNN
jgi:hypothetical protein